VTKPALSPVGRRLRSEMHRRPYLSICGFPYFHSASTSEFESGRKSNNRMRRCDWRVQKTMATCPGWTALRRRPGAMALVQSFAVPTLAAGWPQPGKQQGNRRSRPDRQTAHSIITPWSEAHAAKAGRTGKRWRGDGNAQHNPLNFENVKYSYTPPFFLAYAGIHSLSAI